MPHLRTFSPPLASRQTPGTQRSSGLEQPRGTLSILHRHGDHTLIHPPPAPIFQLTVSSPPITSLTDVREQPGTRGGELARGCLVGEKCSKSQHRRREGSSRTWQLADTERATQNKGENVIQATARLGTCPQNQPCCQNSAYGLCVHIRPECSSALGTAQTSQGPGQGSALGELWRSHSSA